MALSNLQLDTIKGLIYIENDVLSSFTFNNKTYPIIATLTSTERVLEDGGFIIDKALSGTIRIYNADGTYLFTNNVIPQTQQKITYLNDTYRIIQIKIAPQGTHFRIIAMSDVRGI